LPTAVGNRFQSVRIVSAWPIRGLALLMPEAGDPAALPTAKRIDRRDGLGGLIHEYHGAAA